MIPGQAERRHRPARWFTAGNYTFTATDRPAAAAQIGRPLTAAGLFTVNLVSRATVYGPRIRQLDSAAKKIVRFGRSG